MNQANPSKHISMRYYFYIFIAPAMILYFMFFLYPFFQGIGYSFLNWNGIDPEIPTQMDIKKFNSLVNYNIPLYCDAEKFQRKIINLIQSNDDKEFFISFYEKTNDKSEYIFRNNVIEAGNVRDISVDELVRLNSILRGVRYHGIVSDKNINAIKKHYEIMGGNYRLKPGTSIFARNSIKRILKKIGYENIKNVGFDNFLRLGKDPKFKEVITFTVFFTFFNVLLINCIALLLALALDTEIRSRNTLRGMFFLPNILSLIIVAYIWSFIYREAFTSLYNVTGFEIFSLNWLTDIQKAPWAVVLTSVWQGVGYIMVIYLAGLQTIPSDILEVASIDGAGGFKKFTSITLPLLFPSITICFFITLTNSLKTFEIMLALTDGSFKTTSFVLNVYQEAFRRNRVGYSTAQAIVLLFVIMIVSTIQLTIMKRKEMEY